MVKAINPKSAVFYSTNRSWPWGAPDYVWPVAAERLRAEGFPVLAVLHPGALNRPEVESLRNKGVIVYPQPPLPPGGGKLASLKRSLFRFNPAANKLRHTLEQFPEPFLFINQGGDFDFADELFLLPYLQHSDVHFNIIAHSTRLEPALPKSQRHSIQQLLEQAHAFWCNSPWTLETIQTRLAANISHARIFFLPLRFEHQSPLPWPENSTAKLACVCRMDTYHKGLDVLLTALADMKEHPRPWTLNLFGQGSEKDEAYLDDLIRHFNLDKHVRRNKYKSDLIELWSDHHLLVLTSRYEGFGVSMIEAMACGRPVLRTPFGGSEWITDGENGFLCPAAEPIIIRESLERALDRFDQWRTIGHSAHASVLAGYRRHPESMFLDPFGITP